MQRRLFLQLLGIGGAATTLPLISAEASIPENTDFQHFVIREGSYTGRIFDGELWIKGTNAGLPVWLSRASSTLPDATKRYGLAELDEAPRIDMEGSLKAIEAYNRDVEFASKNPKFQWPQDPNVGKRIGQGLALFRDELRAEIEDIWNRSGASPETASLVTVVEEPLHCRFHSLFLVYGAEKPEAKLTIHMHRRHFILEGSLKPSILWSDSGRIPLDDDFVRDDGHHNLKDFRDNQRREIVVLNNNQNIPEDAPSLADRFGQPLKA